ncbi:carboxypeptidase-like regulatory domain-containing protein [Reinekea marina]|uniref:Carboxypeptidase-like regulatory domain-containing protein n=1 Tax=Reinekea marina TaxID=1310421 RepID=A0ABV7WUB8_9GAMM|nr:carboxypeptidase-like regulatory domain-containing protein [Reinekea marina]MDN3650889.1 carboxypeptidase-like regulatory domain-containing protein [Reinekea marina]
MKKLIVVFTLFLVSCASLEPKSTESSALTGTISVELNKPWRLFYKGVQKTPIQIKIENLDTGKTHLIKSNSQGFYFLANVPPGHYAMSQWKIERSTSSENWFMTGALTNNYVEAQPGTIGVFKPVSASVSVISANKNKLDFRTNLGVVNKEALHGMIARDFPSWLSYLK